MINVEWIKEGWVVFRRIHCKEGFIDCWIGDQINNPNNPKMSQYQVNSFTSFFRLNGETEWVSKNSFDNGFPNFIVKNSENFDSTFLWNVSLRTDDI